MFVFQPKWRLNHFATPRLILKGGPTQMLLRVHRSFIVNLQYVKEVRTEADGEPVVVLVEGQRVAMSRGYRMAIEKRLH
jgi:DNA-binding LytR/AlgR family response regulator